MLGETNLRNKMQNVKQIYQLYIFLFFLLHSYVPDINTKGNTIFQHLFANVVLVPTANFQLLACCDKLVCGTTLQVVSESSQVKQRKPELTVINDLLH